ncbi:MAG: long-chain fatty acid transporter, partial [Marivirga sp.]|nr:long-chain fatty acid transporter [Marivirga sp.]
TNDFNRSTSYRGLNQQSSIIDSFIDDADGSTTDQFDDFQYNTPTGLAYFNYLIGPVSLIDPDGPDDEYFTDVKGIPDQREEIETKGSSNQWSFSYGANYKDILFIGGGIGVTTLRYESQKVYSEVFDDDPLFNNLRLDETLDIKGNGINATLGAIVRPVDFLQVGVSFTSPTYYELTETYTAGMNTSWKNFDYYGDGETILNNESAQTDIVTSDYSLTTPLKLSAGVAFLSKYGFLTGDVEFTNPAKAKYSSNISGISFNQENDDIKSVYRSTVNYRLGGEFRYKVFRVRAGYGVQASAYKNDFDIDNSIQTISGGLGVRFEKFFADFALIQSKADNLYSPYSFYVYDIPNPVVDMEEKTVSGILTLGFTF